MKLLRIAFFLLTGVLCNTPVAFSQIGQIVGSWQLVKQGTCLEEAATEEAKEEDLKKLEKQMHSRSPVTARVVEFKENLSATETSRILNMDKNANPKKFYYKFNGRMLLILDKKSQTISDSYTVEKFTADSLILSHATRPCETRIFVKISDDRAN